MNEKQLKDTLDEVRERFVPILSRRSLSGPPFHSVERCFQLNIIYLAGKKNDIKMKSTNLLTREMRLVRVILIFT